MLIDISTPGTQCRELLCPVGAGGFIDEARQFSAIGQPYLADPQRAISRPAISEKRLSLTPNGNVRYQLKTPHRDGTTHVIFEPLDFIARLAALVPEPRVNLTRFHGVFAPNNKYRARVTPAKRGRGGQPATTADPEERTPGKRRAAMSLKRYA